MSGEFQACKCSRCSTIHFTDRAPRMCHVCCCTDGVVAPFHGEEADAYVAAYAIGGKVAVTYAFADRRGAVYFGWDVRGAW